MRPLSEIIIHCTATRAEWWADKTTSQKVAEVRRWHMVDRGWADIGYHFLIDRDGTTANGRAIDKVGAHTQGRNTGTIGIALFGGHGSASTDRFRDHFTTAQDVALRALITALRAKYGTLALSGHNSYASKACPGFQVDEWFNGNLSEQKPQSAEPQPHHKLLQPRSLTQTILKMFGAR